MKISLILLISFLALSSGSYAVIIKNDTDWNLVMKIWENATTIHYQEIIPSKSKSNVDILGLLEDIKHNLRPHNELVKVDFTGVNSTHGINIYCEPKLHVTSKSNIEKMNAVTVKFINRNKCTLTRNK